MYRSRIGDPGAVSVARSLAAEIDNPALAGLLDASPTSWPTSSLVSTR
jgi:hypothetical protein